VIKEGGVIAYPTEYCFGLGCDPRNREAVDRILKIKQRSAKQGLILIAADLFQVEQYATMDGAPLRDDILASWPGPVTWLLGCRSNVPEWLRGQHTTIAMRVCAHPESAAICRGFGGAIVSTSANRHGQPALIRSADVTKELGSELDYVVDASVGGATQASQIRDGITGEKLR